MTVEVLYRKHMVDEAVCDRVKGVEYMHFSDGLLTIQKVNGLESYYDERDIIKVEQEED